MREDGAGKRAKLESDGMRELKSEPVSSFNDQATHALQLRTCRRRPTAWDGMWVGKPARPNY